jgi:hypothetical protein
LSVRQVEPVLQNLFTVVINIETCNGVFTFAIFARDFALS